MRVNRKQLIDELDACFYTLEDRVSNPVMRFFHFYDGHCMSLNNDVITIVPTSLEFEDTFSVIGKNFYNLICKLPSEVIDITYEDKELKIKSGRTLSKIVTSEFDLDEYFKNIEKVEENYVALPKDLAKDLDFVMKSAATESMSHGSFCVHFCEDYIECVSDTRMTRRTYDQKYFENSCLIRHNAFPYIMHIKPIEASFGEETVIFRGDGDVRIYVNLPFSGDSEFPNKELLDGFLKDLPTRLYLPENILDILKRSKFMAETDKGVIPCVGMKFDGNRIDITVHGSKDFGVFHESLGILENNPEVIVYLPIRDFYEMYLPGSRLSIDDHRERLVIAGDEFEQTIMVIRNTTGGVDFVDVEEDVNEG